jgi:phage terminase large subunit-like protein
LTGQNPGEGTDPWSLACPDWEQRLRDGRSLVPDLPLDRAEADKALKIFNRLKLPDVPGTPALGEAGGEWFRDIVAAIFGSIDPATGRRRVRANLTEVPKKNSKTTNAAGLMLTAMLMNKRPRAEFLLVGPTQAISELAYNQAEGMVRADEVLAARFHVQSHLKKITYRGKVRSSLQVRTFDSKVLTGVKPVGVLVDELHELGKIANAERVIGQIRGGLYPFPEAFLVFITTQSDEPPAGVFHAELKAARDIRDGKAPANGMLPVLYEFPRAIIESGKWRDPSLWPMVTPNLNRSVRLEVLVEGWDEAQQRGEKEMRRWASQHLNVEIGLALGSDAWAGASYWENNADPRFSLEELLERCDVVTVGIDGGGLDDLLGLSVIGREKQPTSADEEGEGTVPDLRRWLLWAHAWCHRGVLELRKDIASRLEDFAADEDLTIVDRIGDDVAAVADIVEQVAASGLLPEKKAIGVDPAGIGEIIEELAERGVDATPESGVIVGIPQGWKLNGAIKTTERRLAGGTLRHTGSRLMAWCVGNAKVEPIGNAIRITKQVAGKAKIDPLMALFNAAHLMSLNPEVGTGQALEAAILARGGFA